MEKRVLSCMDDPAMAVQKLWDVLLVDVSVSAYKKESFRCRRIFQTLSSSVSI